MHIFVILINVLKGFDLEIEDMLIFVIINHCCGVFFSCPSQTSVSRQCPFSLDFLMIKSGFLYDEICSFSVQISSCGCFCLC